MKKSRFPLIMADGAETRSLEDLREHFDLKSVLEYYKNGRLLTWLQDRYLEEEAEALQTLNEQTLDFQSKLCAIFGVAYTGELADMEAISYKQERLAKLRSFTDEAEHIEHIDQVAFDQEELADLLDDGVKEIYLCGKSFSIPSSQKGITYIGVNSPCVHISGKLPESADGLGIELSGCEVDNLPAPGSRSATIEPAVINISEFEEITIGSAVHIPAGTAQTYDHKIIHVQAPINCEGSLEFHSCVIHYGEIEWNVKIELAKSASLTMQQSTIENHSCSKESFIVADGFSEYDTPNYPSKVIEFRDCEFINCWRFLETQKRPVKINNCHILNAGAYFIKACDVESVISLNCSEFTYEKEPDFYPERAARITLNIFNNAVLDVDVLKMTECRVDGLLHINNPNADLERVGFYSDIIHFCSGSRYDGELQITNSSLEGCVSLFDDYAKVSISQSVFLHCGNILAGGLFGISSVELRECRFDNCSKIGLELENSKILYCQFNTCFQQLFSTSKKGGVTFENCEFNNWQASNKTRPDDNEQSSGTLDMLHFKREDKNCASSSVVNCSFNGVIANDCFIISGYQLYKLKYGYVANVENCKFDHCTTKRESRKIIKEYLIPYFKFIKPNEAEIGVYLRNCSGLDFVNMSSGTVENFTPKTQISTGQPIGMTTKVENAGVLGYVSSAV